MDGRFHPWDDSWDPTWAKAFDTQRGVLQPVVVDSFPVDVSPYGARGMGGNVRDWCVVADEPGGPGGMAGGSSGCAGAAR